MSESSSIPPFDVVHNRQLLYCFYRVTTTRTPSIRRTRAAGRRSSRGKQIARWTVVCFALAVIVDAVVGDRGLLAMLRAREQYEAATASLQQQRQENAALKEQVRRLTDDPAAIEELARGELGLMRPGEKLFIVKDLEPPAAH
jgi:cell division protein FtsB